MLHQENNHSYNYQATGVNRRSPFTNKQPLSFNGVSKANDLSNDFRSSNQSMGLNNKFSQPQPHQVSANQVNSGHQGASPKGNSPNIENQIFVGGITCKTKRQEIMDIFSRFGTVTNIRLIRNKRGATKGYCFLSFLTPQGVENAINSENIWLRNRLISIRKMKAGVQLKNLRDQKADTRITVYGFAKNISSDDSQACRDFFSSLGKLEFYYFVKMRCDKIINDEISQYIDENNLKIHQFDKINLLNIGYKDSKITSDLMGRKKLTINGIELIISHFTEYKKLDQDDHPKIQIPISSPKASPYLTTRGRGLNFSSNSLKSPVSNINTEATPKMMSYGRYKVTRDDIQNNHYPQDHEVSEIQSQVESYKFPPRNPKIKLSKNSKLFNFHNLKTIKRKLQLPGQIEPALIHADEDKKARLSEVLRLSRGIIRYNLRCTYNLRLNDPVYNNNRAKRTNFY